MTENPIPRHVYHMVDDYSGEFYAGMPEHRLPDAERASLAGYFNALIVRLMRDEPITGEMQTELAAAHGVELWRIASVAEFLSNWGRDPDYLLDDDEESANYER